VHLIRNTFHLASKKDWDALRRDVKPIYTAVNAQAAWAALDPARRDLGHQIWGDHPAVGERVGAVHPVPGVPP
jgi:hypothetical protein